MRQITFRPLRRIKKTGKITVASYMQWRKIKTADYDKFRLVINNEHKTLPPDEYVYNHKGERLFWRDYNPADIPVYSHDVMKIHNDFDNLENNKIFFAELSDLNNVTGYGVLWGVGGAIYYNCKGLDCDGVPAFSHNTDKELTIGNNHSLESINEYEPLTVGMVTKWFGWFLYQLENSHLKIGGL